MFTFTPIDATERVSRGPKGASAAIVMAFVASGHDAVKIPVLTPTDEDTARWTMTDDEAVNHYQACAAWIRSDKGKAAAPGVRVSRSTVEVQDIDADGKPAFVMDGKGKQVLADGQPVPITVKRIQLSFYKETPATV